MLRRKEARQPPGLVEEAAVKGLAEPERVQELERVQVVVTSSRVKVEEEAAGTMELVAVDVDSNLAVVVVEVDKASSTRPGPPSNGMTGATSSGARNRNSPRVPGKARRPSAARFAGALLTPPRSAGSVLRAETKEEELAVRFGVRALRDGLGHGQRDGSR